jgi:GDPmannose 4,6-dehydratase
LEAIRLLGLQGKTRFFQASTSEMFGSVNEGIQSETTRFCPRSPYAISKLFAYWMTINYREAYGLYACNGILFNHESPLRGETFVTRKITRALARIKIGLQKCLYLGNLDAVRDWGHARDYIEIEWLMLQQKKPDDYVIATGIQNSVRSFVEVAAKNIGISIRWKGSGINEVGFDSKNRKIVAVDPRYYRPTDVPSLLGDSTKAQKQLGWRPKTSFEQLVKEMVQEDLKNAEKESIIKAKGFKVMQGVE